MGPNERGAATERAPQQVITIVSTDRERAAFTRIAGLQPFRGKIITESYLRVEQPMVNGQNNYNFDIQKTSGSSNTENKLDLNDAFVMTKIGMFLTYNVSTTPYIGVLQTYPNNEYFTLAGVTPAHMEAFYNGNYKITVGQTVFLNALDTRRFRYVGTAQQSSPTTKSEQHEDSGLSFLARQIILQGQGNNQIVLNVPSFAAQAIVTTAANTTTQVVFYARGFLVTGGSQLGNLDTSAL